LPVVLHLVMRQEPQRLVFPAMRFLERRRATNQTRLRLQHWLLLALRCAAIALLAAALARPVLRSNAGDGAAGQGLAAAIVLDNAPRLGYVQDNRSRLDAAKETAAWLLGQFAADSRVAVIDRGDGSRRLADRDAALLRAERVMLRADTRPLADAVADALAVVGEQTDARQEVYVFTDLADAEWSESARERVSDALDRHSGARLYVVDVGVPRAINRGLRAVELSTTSPLAGQEVTVRTGFYATASAPTQPTTIELWLSDGDAPPQKRGETIVQAAESGDGTDAAVEFSLAALDEGVHQGFVRVLGSDPLAADDLRHFTLSVEPAKPLLVAAASESAALFVREAISPSAAGAAAWQPLTFLRFDQLPSAELADIAGVMLLDPPGLPSDVWRRLAGYARRGGSVAVF
ncbi:MAG: BatA domain-containing protein, partial [Planctomycetota bacterium]